MQNTLFCDTIDPMYMDRHRLTLGILLSLGLHLAFLALLPLRKWQKAPPQQASIKTEAIKIEMIDPKNLKKYRSVGIKNGAKEFSLPVSLKSLRTSNHENISYSYKSKSDTPKENLVKQLSVDNYHHAILHQTDLNINFVPNEGVSEDQLNSSEKMFWSFRKRTYESYVSSFIKTYQQFMLERPRIKYALKQEKHLMSGMIVFDSEGNIMRIKIIQPSISDDFHDLFEQTLKTVNRLPNPPVDIVRKGKFTIYYQLRINV